MHSSANDDDDRIVLWGSTMFGREKSELVTDALLQWALPTFLQQNDLRLELFLSEEQIVLFKFSRRTKGVYTCY